MSANPLYQRIVLEHSRAPRHFGALAAATHAADGDNPLCGDALHVELCVADGCIEAIAFRGEACAITRATASLLGGRISRIGVEEVAQLEARFAELINGESQADAALGDLNALATLANYPARRKCALLPFATVRAALAGITKTTTERGPMSSSATIVTTALPDAIAVSFQRATRADVPLIEALVTSAYRGDASRAGWTTEADLLDGQRVDPVGLAEIIEKPGSRVILTYRGERLLACCHVEKQGEACYFGMFAVDPTLQGGGVGKLVMTEAERVAREDFGCVQMQMTVISVRDELVAWYERRGYRRTGTYKPFPYGDQRFGVPKRDDLRFELLAKAL